MTKRWRITWGFSDDEVHTAVLTRAKLVDKVTRLMRQTITWVTIEPVDGRPPTR